MKRPVVAIRSLQYSYPDGSPALNGIDLAIGEGESVGIIGPNGAGKTTLLLHLNGIVNIDPRVTILGMEMHKKNLRAIRSRVGLVFQNPDDQLFSPTVFDDIAFGPRNMGCDSSEVHSRVERALHATGMDSYANKTPHHLSSGEKKKIAIATVLALPCELLVLDEPSSNLDPRSRRNLIELLKGLRQTRIIASHDADLVRELCSRVIVLDRGQVVADAAPGVIFGDAALLEKHQLDGLF